MNNITHHRVYIDSSDKAYCLSRLYAMKPVLNQDRTGFKYQHSRACIYGQTPVVKSVCEAAPAGLGEKATGRGGRRGMSEEIKGRNCVGGKG